MILDNAQAGEDFLSIVTVDNTQDEETFAFVTDDGDLADVNAKAGEIFAVNVDGGLELEELALDLESPALLVFEF